MAQYPCFPLWTDAYLGDTTHLTTIEHGAYLLLLITAWRSKNASLPDDDKILARYARLNNAQWKKIRPVLEQFFFIENGVWIQGRLKDEYEAVKQLSKDQSRRAKARWLKNKESDDATASSWQCRNDATPTPTPTPKKINKKELKKPENVSEQTWFDFIEIRKNKKAPVTQTAITRIQNQAEKIGWTLEEALQEICSRAWRGFDSTWIDKSRWKIKKTQMQEDAEMQRKIMNGEI